MRGFRNPAARRDAGRAFNEASSVVASPAMRRLGASTTPKLYGLFALGTGGNIDIDTSTSKLSS